MPMMPMDPAKEVMRVRPFFVIRLLKDKDRAVRKPIDVRRAGFEHLVALGETYDGPHDKTLTFFSVTEPEAWLCDIDGSWNPIALP